MTAATPNPSGNYPIEPKVKWASIAMYLAGVVLMALVAALTGDNNALLLAVLPDPVEIFVIPLVPTLAGLAAGYAAKHQYRDPEYRNDPSTSPPTHIE